MKQKTIYRLYAAFVILYIVLLFFLPANTSTLIKHHLNQLTYHTLLFVTIGIPTILTWFAACYGYDKTKQYADSIRRAPEGPAFQKLGKGIGWVALCLPLASIVLLSLMAIANVIPGFKNGSLVVSNYIMLVVAIIALSSVSHGARLMAEVGQARPTTQQTRVLSLLFIIIGVFYCYILISGALYGPNPYHMPVLLLLLTVAVPYLYAWFMGLLALLDINAYAGNAAGLLYRGPLRVFSAGILIIISTSILIQYISSVSTVRGYLIFGVMLLARYALYATVAVGFLLIGYGANKLQQIERI